MKIVINIADAKLKLKYQFINSLVFKNIYQKIISQLEKKYPYFLFLCFSFSLFSGFSYINNWSENTRTYIQISYNLSYQEFGLVKRALIPSILKLFHIEPTIQFLKIFFFSIYFSLHVLLYIILKNLSKSIKEKNTKILFYFFIFTIFISPISISRLVILLYNDLIIVFLFFISYYLLLFKENKNIIYFIVMILTCIAIFIQEIYIVFFFPLIFSFIFLKKKSYFSMFLFSFFPLFCSIILIIFGKIESISLEEFTNKLIQLNVVDIDYFNNGIDKDAFIVNYFGSIKEHFLYTLSQINHINLVPFFIFSIYLLIWLYFFISTLFKNKKSLWYFLSVLPSLLIFCIGTDWGRWLSFIIFEISAIFFFWSINGKIVYNKILLFFLLSFNLFGTLGLGYQFHSYNYNSKIYLFFLIIFLYIIGKKFLNASNRFYIK